MPRRGTPNTVPVHGRRADGDGAVEVHVSLGALPGVLLQAALEEAKAGLTEPRFGALSTEQV
jgi:hypothetical protein